nr:TIR domain-containing protein [Desulfosarcina cetonica]
METRNYKAFLSYSHAADKRLAPALQSALHRFGKPFYRLRTMHVFRDKTGLQLTPELWPEIRKKLRASEYLILLASPQAAASPWVNMEIQEWMQTHDHRLENFCLILTHGQIIWNNQLRDFDWHATDALPSLLAGQFKHEPLYLDLRWTHVNSEFFRRDERWLDDVGTLAATLLDKPKDSLIGEDRRQFHLARRLIFSGTVLVVSLAIALTAQFFIAQRRARAVLANQLSAQATNNIDHPHLAALLAIESMRLEPSVVAERQLHKSAKLLARRISSFVHEDEVIGVQFLPGDEKLLTASHDGSARVWKITDGTEVQRRTFSKSVIDIAVSPDGQILAASSYEGAVAAWRADNGETLLTYPEQYAGVDFAPSGRRLAVVGRETVIWDVSGDGRIEEVARKKLGVGSTRVIAFSDDARRLAIGGKQFQILVVDVPTLEEVMRCKVDWVMDVALNRDGTLLAAALDDNTVRLWQVPNCKEILHVRHKSGASAVAISEDGQFLATGSHDGSAKVFCISNLEEIQVVEHDVGIWDVALSPDARLLATSGRDGTARIWDVETGGELQRIPHAGDVYEVHFSSDGTTLATASEDGTAAVWDITATIPLLVTQIQADGAQLVGFVDEAKGLLTASSEHHSRVFDVVTGTQYPSKKSLTGSESPEWDRRLIAADGVVCPVKVWSDGAGGGPNRLVTYPLRKRIAMSRDCRYLATWEELSKETEDDTQSKEPGVITIDFGPPRSTGVRIWDCQSGQEVVWVRHAKDPTISSSIVDMQFSPDARFLATASMDKTARLWSVTNGAEVRRFEHQDTVIKVLFSLMANSLPLGQKIGPRAYGLCLPVNYLRTCRTRLLYRR